MEARIKTNWDEKDLYTGNGIIPSLSTVILRCDPIANIALVERLNMLMACKAAGNTGVRNELVSVCDAVSWCFKVFTALFHGESWCFVVFQGVSLLCFVLFHAVSRCFIALFHCCFKVFHYSASCCSRCFNALFHPVS